MRVRNVLQTVVFGMVFAIGLATAQATTWDAYTGFHVGSTGIGGAYTADSSNDGTQLWQYGYQTQGVYSYDQYSVTGYAGVGYVHYNAWGPVQPYYGSGDIDGWQGNGDWFFGVEPGVGLRLTTSSTSTSWVGWKSPITGTVDISFSLTGLGGNPGYDGTEYWLFQAGNNAWLSHGLVADQGATGLVTVSNVAVVAGDLVHLSVGPGPAQQSPDDFVGVTFSITSVPEPGTLVLLVTGLLGLLAYAWRKRR